MKRLTKIQALEAQMKALQGVLIIVKLWMQKYPPQDDGGRNIQHLVSFSLRQPAGAVHAREREIAVIDRAVEGVSMTDHNDIAWYVKAVPWGVTHRLIVEVGGRTDNPGLCGFEPKHGWFMVAPQWWDVGATICWQCFSKSETVESSHGMVKP